VRSDKASGIRPAPATAAPPSKRRAKARLPRWGSDVAARYRGARGARSPAMLSRQHPKDSGSARFCCPANAADRLPGSVRHLALLPVLVLVVLDDGGNGLEPVLVAFLHCLLEIEVLDRDMVRAEFEVAAHRLEVGLFRRASHFVLLAESALDGTDHAVE